MKSYKELITEALSAQQRMTRSIVARRTARLRQVSRNRKKFRRKSEEELGKKARKSARKHIMKRYLGGMKWKDVPFSAREQIEKMADKRKSAIEKTTLRLMPHIRKGEDARLRQVQKKTR